MYGELSNGFFGCWWQLNLPSKASATLKFILITRPRKHRELDSYKLTITGMQCVQRASMVVDNVVIITNLHCDISICFLQTFYTRCRLQHQMDLIDKEVSNLL